MKDCFETSLKSIYPDVKIRGQGRGMVELKDATSNELTLGAFQTVLASKSTDLAKRMERIGKKGYGNDWWSTFAKRLDECRERRNKCCHSGLFSWIDQSNLLAEMFMSRNKDLMVQMGGILFESKIGKMLS